MVKMLGDDEEKPAKRKLFLLSFVQIDSRRIPGKSPRHIPGTPIIGHHDQPCATFQPISKYQVMAWLY